MSEEFRRIIKNAGIPTTQQEIKQRFEKTANENASPFSNNSEFSPFWRIIRELVSTPVLWLIDFMVSNVMPNSFLKTATGESLELLASDYNVTPRQKQKAQGNIVFERTNARDVVDIKKNTVIQSPLINGVIYELTVLNDVQMQTGENRLSVAVEAVSAGASYNLAEGFYSILVEPIEAITQVSNAADWLTRPGTNDETDEALRQRTRVQFGNVARWHIDSVYRAMIAAFPGINANQIYFEHNAPRGPGTANIYILLDTGNPSQAFLDEIKSFIMDEGNHGNGDDVDIRALPETFHSMAVAVWPVKFLSDQQTENLQKNIDLFIRTAFRESTAYSNLTLTKPFSRFSISRLTQELHREFEEIETLAIDISDINSDLSIPRLNTLTVSFND